MAQMDGIERPAKKSDPLLCHATFPNLPAV
jgi:hypothetical protein